MSHTCGECRFANSTLYEVLMDCEIDMELYLKNKEACSRFEKGG